MADEELLAKPLPDCTAAELLELAEDVAAVAAVETNPGKKMSARNAAANLSYLASLRS